MIALIKALQVILALSILIFIHELGHFTWAKIFHIRVEKFFLFFDIGGKKLCSWKWGDTEFGIGWLPLGGYCKVSGMIDESMDMEQMKKEPKEYEFRSHPAGHRLMVMAGGVLNNFIFAVLVYIAIAGIWGESYIENKGTKVYAGALAEEMGFRTGDEILKLDDYEPERFLDIQADLAFKDIRKATVLRESATGNGYDTLDIYIDRSLVSRMLQEPLFDIALPFVVDSVIDSSVSPFRKGDRVLSFGGKKVSFIQDAREVLAGMRGTEADAVIVRGLDTLSVPVAVDSVGRVGVFLKMPSVKTRSYSLAEAIPAGLRQTGEQISGYVKQLKMLATPSTGAYKSVGSFIAIGQVFPSQWNWLQFMSILALLSIMLGVMNLIPIPGLDGGHIMFTIYEMITGRKPSDRFMYIMQIIGMVLIVALMMLAFGNDIGRLIR